MKNARTHAVRHAGWHSARHAASHAGTYAGKMPQSTEDRPIGILKNAIAKILGTFVGGEAANDYCTISLSLKQAQTQVSFLTTDPARKHKKTTENKGSKTC